jgi:glycerol-3-phosphate dehydrogenase
VVFAHLGFLPLEGEGGSEAVAKLLCRHSRVIDHEREGGVAGLIGIEGVKYTTATATAVKAVRLAAKKLKRTVAPLREDPLLFGKPMQPSGSTIEEEVVHALRHEMACTLADVVFRRTGLGTVGHPGGEALEKCAALMAAELGWDPGRIRQEIAVVEEIYRSLLPLASPPPPNDRGKST